MTFSNYFSILSLASTVLQRSIVMSSPAQTKEVIVPLVHNRIVVPGSDVVFSAACFEGNDWSLGPLQRPEDVEKNPSLAHRVGCAVHGLSGRKVYAPNPTKFNAAIIQPWNLDRELILPMDVHLYRNQDHPADGTFLRMPTDAGI
ncbi:MAG: hypothetical protein U1C66_00220, partial [Patescibacteria group bacterium]|nr:hypothetical protein [Patescibacteria group bacterium]